MARIEDTFDPVKEVINLNLSFLERLFELDLAILEDDARDFLLAQLRKNVGMVGNLIKKYDKSSNQ